MLNARLDGVYLISSERTWEDGFFLFPCKKTTISYQYFLFHKNTDTEQVKLYKGSVGGDFLYWMKEFAQWSPNSHKNNLILDYTIKYNTLSFSSWDIFLKKDMKHSIEVQKNKLLYESDYLKKRDNLFETYHFFPFPPSLIYE